MSKQKEMRLLIQELSELSNKPNWDKRDTARNSSLLAMLSAVKSGVSMKKIQQDDVNDAAAELGVPRTKFKKEKRSMKVARDFRRFCLETPDGTPSITSMKGAGPYSVPEARDQGFVGDPLTGIGHYAGLGFFVPNEFIRDTTKAAMRLGDEILDPDVCTMVTSTNGRPLVLPIYNDTDGSTDAVPIGENAQGTVNDVQHPAEISLGAISFRQTFVTSLESLQDVEASENLLDLWQEWTAQRIARGVSKLVMNGSSSDKIVGLVQTLENLAVVPIIAQGNSESTGGAQTGANSVGNSDLVNMYYNLDKQYRNSPRCNWLMSDLTALQLSLTLDKFGRPLLKWDGEGMARIFGKPVRICPSMASIGASNVPILFGDTSYVYVRRVVDELSGVRVLRETYADAGQFGLQSITRWDFKLAYNGWGKPPFTMLQNHS